MPARATSSDKFHLAIRQNRLTFGKKILVRACLDCMAMTAGLFCAVLAILIIGL